MMLVTPILVMALAGQAPVDVGGGQLAAAPLAQVRDTADSKDAADPSPPLLQKEDLKEPPTPPHTGIRALFGNLLEDIKHLPAMQNVYVAGGGGVFALAAHPVDARFGVFMTNHYDTVNTIFAPGKYIGDTAEQVALSMGTYAFGRIFDKPKVSHFGMDLVQAQILTEMLVEPIKFAVGRPRPDGSNNQSFPSGHAAITFATATVIERHLGWRKSLLAYGIASYVAASRIHDNRHYLSDIIFGAAIGTVAGRTVVHHASDYWAISPVKVPGGVAILITRNTDR